MEYIEKIFKKSGWISLFKSIIFVILGLILIFKPEETVQAIAYALGGIFILAGIYKIINYYLSKGKYNFYDYDLAYGLAACLIGIIAIICNTKISAVFRIIIGIWIIYSSFIRLDLSVKLKNLDSNIWIYSLILSITMLICGLYVIMNSGAIIVTLGAIVIIYAIIDIIEDIIFIRNVKQIF